MSENPLTHAGSLIAEVLDSVRDGRSGLKDRDIVDVLSATRELTRLVSRLQVEAVAALQRRDAFVRAGHKRPESPLATVLTVDRRQVREIVRAAEHVGERVDGQGEA